MFNGDAASFAESACTSFYLVVRLGLMLRLENHFIDLERHALQKVFSIRRYFSHT